MNRLGIIKSLSCKLFFIIFLSFLFSFHSQQIFSAETDLENLHSFNPDLTRAYDRIKIREAWAAIKQSGASLSPIRIGIVDTGIDSNHPEFQRVNLGSIEREDLRDFEPNGHGTQIAGIIGANNLSKTQALKPDSPQMNGILSGVLDAGDYVFEIIWTTDFTPLNQLLESVQVVNMSIGAPLCSASPIRSKISEILLGKTCYTEEEFLDDVKKYTDLIKNHPEVIFVVAAGNEDIDVGFTMPAGLEFSNVIVVGATDLDDKRAWWGLPFLQASNYGNGVDIAAPGEKIYAPKPDGGYDENFGGTSGAAPLVTGVVGLMLSLNPNLKPKEIRDILIETGDPIRTDKPLSGRRLNALNAVTKVIRQIQTSKIIVEDADNVWEIIMESPPSELIYAAGDVTPRVIIEYADSVYYSDLNAPPSELVSATSSVTPRVVIEYADSISHSILNIPPSGLVSVASDVTPRIIVEYADSIFSITLSRFSAEGGVEITGQGIKGDVNNDGKIRSNDAMLALRIAAGLLEPSDYQKWAADMNEDGKIGANDAFLILRQATGSGAPDIQPTVATSETITVILGEAHGLAGESITVPLHVDKILNLAAGDIRIAYNRAVLKAIEVSSDADLLLQSNIAESGIIRIAFASADRLKSKTIVKIRFNILADDVSPLMLQKVELYQSNALLVNSKKIDGQFSSWAIPPEHTALLQNFPNPFNPDTWIPFELSQKAEVIISIYDIKGKLVRTLHLGHKKAGIYTTKERAAYWDGKNSDGERVSSGVSFYTIQAGPFQATKKMVIAR